MDRYQRVVKDRTPADRESMAENEIRVTTQGQIRHYISYALSLLQEKGADEVVLKAMGKAINKTVTIAEVLKRRVEGLHQNTHIGSVSVTDLWEPLEEGLLPLETVRHVSLISVTLSKLPLDASAPGYQAPLPAELVRPMEQLQLDTEDSFRGRRRGGRGGRGRGRGGRGGDYPSHSDGPMVAQDGEEGSEALEGSEGQLAGEPRSRGGFRGRGRGGHHRHRYPRGEGGEGDSSTVQADGFEEHGVQGQEAGRGRGRSRRRGRGRGRRGGGGDNQTVEAFTEQTDATEKQVDQGVTAPQIGE